MASQKGVRLTPPVAFVLLLLARGISARRNLVHDCDEVFNYWEPLHFVLYGFGFQTWEYSAEFALRSWLYILLHTAVAAPAAWWYGAEAGKAMVFVSTRAALGLVSAVTETLLFSVVQRRCGHGTARRLLWLLCLSSGMFTSATTFLPSTFAMYALTAGTAALLQGWHAGVILAAALGILWGWVVAAVAFLPHALWVLCCAPLQPAVRTAVAAVLALGGLLAAVDAHFYGRWTASLWNFVMYNVVGGGQSALYGVEGPLFYLHNGGLAFNAALPLALALPALAALQRLFRSGSGGREGSGDAAQPLARSQQPRGGKQGPAGGGVANGGTLLALAAALAPLWLWLAAISALPHKEERFLYVVYPLVCMAAALSLGAVEDVASSVAGWILRRRSAETFGRVLQRGLLAATLAVSVARTGALLRNYSAPMNVFASLHQLPAGSEQLRHVCVGNEWYRFPSSFHLPGPQYRLQFVRSDFHGLLPRPFSPNAGGTRAAPRQLNDQNREEAANYWAGSGRCDFFVGPAPPADSDPQDWTAIASEPFLDKDASPPLGRAFLLPWSSRPNVMVPYAMWQRILADGKAGNAV